MCHPEAIARIVRKLLRIEILRDAQNDMNGGERRHRS